MAGAGNGPIIGVKASRNLTNKVFCNGDFSLNFRKNGIIPGLVGSRSRKKFINIISITILHYFIITSFVQFYFQHLRSNWTNTQSDILRTTLVCSRRCHACLSIVLINNTFLLHALLEYPILLFQQVIRKNSQIMK